MKELFDLMDQARAWYHSLGIEDWRGVATAIAIFALVYVLFAYSVFWRKKPLPEGKVGEMTKKQRRRITDALVADEILDGMERLVLKGRLLNGEHYHLTDQEEKDYIRRIGRAASLRDLTTRYRPKPPPSPEELKAAIKARREKYRGPDGEIIVIRFMDPVQPPAHIQRRIRGSKLGMIIYKNFKPTPPALTPGRLLSEGK